MDNKKYIRESYLNGLNLLKNMIDDDSLIYATDEIAKIIIAAYNNNKKGLICGNGGSLCDAMHFAEEFTGRFRKERAALPVISLSDSSHITCVSNDYGFNEIFSRGVQAFGKEGDYIILLSTSGNSQNVINAFNVAKEKKLKTIALLGKDGGKLKGKADIEIIVNEKTSDRIQEIHMMLLHIVIEIVERNLFPENY